VPVVGAGGVAGGALCVALGVGDDDAEEEGIAGSPDP
jgi:hypothetical protein